MNIVSLFFYFSLALLSGIASYASDPNIVPSSTEITPAGSVATSFRSTPRLPPAGVDTSEMEGFLMKQLHQQNIFLGWINILLTI